MTIIEHRTISIPPGIPTCENEELLRFQQVALYDYRNTSDIQEHLIQCSNHLLKNPFNSILRGIKEGDGEKVLDIGLRCVLRSIKSFGIEHLYSFVPSALSYYTGCQCSAREANIDRALYVWEMITNDHHQYGVPEVSNSLLARAYSVLCCAYFELHEKACRGTAVTKDTTLKRSWRPLPLPSGKPDFDLANNYLYVSALYANGAAELGLVSPAVLNVAQHLRRVAKRDGFNLGKSKRYGHLVHLWRAAEARSREWEKSKAPNAYVCAAPGCGIQGTQKKALLRCAGR
ncbi:hypothetical protein BV20DRAFT_227814 [Pilatotrama ljubarskyi]|nr:hypothetical protein BV20DRAFT_227814 [Pilatotrama ljubarskyi]